MIECADWCGHTTPHDGPCAAVPPRAPQAAPAALVMPIPTGEQRTVMHRQSLAVATQARAVVRVLDRAHALGLAIPPKAADAAATLAALGEAWAANSAGHPAPRSTKQQLGLVP